MAEKAPPLLIHIVESPSLGEIEAQHAEGRLLRDSLRLSGVDASYRVVTSADSFKKALLAFYWARLHSPEESTAVLHISAHGYPTENATSGGLGFTNSDRLSWNDLEEPIRLTCEGKALFCTSSCFGFEGFQMALNTKELPFLALLGHTEKPYFDVAAIGYTVFYHRLAHGASPDEAWLAMREATGDDGFELISAAYAQKVFLKLLDKAKADKLMEKLEALTPTSGAPAPAPQT